MRLSTFTLRKNRPKVFTTSRSGCLERILAHLELHHRRISPKQNRKHHDQTSVRYIAALTVAALPLMAAEKFDFSKLDLSKLPPPAAKTAITYAKTLSLSCKARAFAVMELSDRKAACDSTVLKPCSKGAKTARSWCPATARRVRW
jgi:hypothetical protein